MNSHIACFPVLLKTEFVTFLSILGERHISIFTTGGGGGGGGWSHDISKRKHR